MVGSQSMEAKLMYTSMIRRLGVFFAHVTQLKNFKKVLAEFAMFSFLKGTLNKLILYGDIRATLNNVCDGSFEE